MKLTSMSLAVVFAVTCVILAATPVTVAADENYWIMTLRASSSAGVNTLDPANIGWRTGYTNGIDPGENNPPAYQGGATYAYIVSLLDGTYPSLTDFRTPWTLDKTSKTWHLQAYTVGPGYIDPIKITINQTAAAFPYSSTGSIGLYWLGGQAIFNASNPLTSFTFYLSGATQSNPANIYVVVPVPEPSSLTGLLSGLGLLGGLKWRRRS